MVRRTYFTHMIILLVFSLLFLASGVYSEPLSYSTDLSVDWRKRTMQLSFRFSVPEDGPHAPDIRRHCLRTSTSRLGNALVKEFSRVRLDSARQVGDFLRNNPEKASTINTALADAYQSGASSFSKDFSTFSVSYTYSLTPRFLELFYTHQSPEGIVPILEFVPSGPFSGIVVYVEKSLPVHGTSETGRLTPALFPRFFNEEMELIISKDRVSPSALSSRGMVSYYGVDEVEHLTERVGEVPLYTKAKALFGVERTDIVLSERGAETILSGEKTLELIKKGRIAIVYHPVSH